MNEPAAVPELLDAINRARDPEPAAPPAPLRRLLGLQIGDDLYGLEIEGIREIRKLLPLTFVPGAPPTILGVTNLRGQMLPVVDLRLLLGLAPWQAAPGDAAALAHNRARLVVVSHNEVTVGLLVEGVSEVYETRALLAAPLGTRAGTPIIAGQLAVGDRLLLLLNLAQLVSRLTG